MKTLKMVAVVDGKMTDVGRCHPGQARIMQKNGLAAVREGKVWLLSPPATRVVGDVVASPSSGGPGTEGSPLVDPSRYRVWDDVVVTPEEVLHRANEALRVGEALRTWRATHPAQKAFDKAATVPVGRSGLRIRPVYPTEEEVRAAEEARSRGETTGIRVADLLPPERDPGYLKTILAEAWCSSSDAAVADCMGVVRGQRPEPEEVVAPTLAAFLRALADAVAAGHETGACDDPRSRRIGFMDYTANKLHQCPLTYLKEAGGDIGLVASELGLDAQLVREGIFSLEGRKKLFGDGGFGVEGEGLPEEPLEWGVPPDVSDVFFPPKADAPPRFESLDGFREWADGRVGRVYTLPSFYGWTPFQWPGDDKTIPMDVAYGQHIPVPAKHGLYRREGERLFRVWVPEDITETWWDESRMTPQGCYSVVETHRPDLSDAQGPLTPDPVARVVNMVEARINPRLSLGHAP